MDLAHFIMMNNELIKKDTDIIPYQSPLIILYGKSAVCMANNGKDTKHTRHISRIIYFVINGKEWNLHKKCLFEVRLQLSDIGTKNVREDEFNPILGYTMVIFGNWHNSCELFQPQMGQFTYWTSMVPVIWAQFRIHVLGSKTLFWIN